MHRLNVTIEFKNGNERDIEIAVNELIVFSWTGRNIDIVKKLVEEREKYGIKPRTIPEYYRLQPYLITTSNYIRKISDTHVGEVEYVLLIRNEDEIFITVGSDHTDIDAERCNILAGKHMYPKVVARRAWPLDEVEKHIDKIILRSWILEDSKKTLYQDGNIGMLIRPEKLIEQVREIVEDMRNVVVFSGTIPTVTGQLKVSEYFEIKMIDPVLDREISHYYWVD
ncbi:MAG: DUF2848 domain-containing protein [Crenarchaeota archaeon]|jgi:hypothetical protein|nr:DUF2848 domain-containing protein [Thermoproteota archaeon]